MKKATLKNLIVILGLLILCIMTLTAIYATTPESAVLLLDETFANLDKTKWRHEIAECTEDGQQFQYAAADGLTADGILHVLANLTSPEFRMKREASRDCNSCPDSSLFFASLATKRLFHARAGIIEVRAKFRKGSWLIFRIALVSNDSNSEGFRSSAEATKATENNFAQLQIIFESATNRTVLKSGVTDNDFHIYRIQWDSERITLSTDHQKVDEKTFQSQMLQDGSLPKATAPVTQPFYLTVEVDFGEKSLENWGADDRSSTEATNQEKGHHKEESILEIDYIRLFRTEEWDT